MESPKPCHSRTADQTDNILTDVDNLFTETNTDTNYPQKVIWTDNKVETNTHKRIENQQTGKSKTVSNTTKKTWHQHSTITTKKNG